MEIEFNELGFHVQKTSSMNSFSIHGKLVFIELGRWLRLMFGCVCRRWTLSDRLLIRSCLESLLLGLLDQITKSSAI